MHLVIDSEKGIVEGVVCISREAQTCYILLADIERLQDLVSLAKAQGVNEVRVVAPDKIVKEMEGLGWQKIPNVTVMRK